MSFTIRPVKIIYVIILVIVCFVIFSRTLTHDFVWDDTGPHLLQNPYLEKLSLGNLGHFWTNQYQGLYIPISYTFIMLISLFSRILTSSPFNPALFHFFNVLFHCLNTLLLFFLISKSFKHDLAAFLGALIFLVHPVQVEAVAMVTEFRGLLATFWGLVFLHTYISWLKEKNILQYLVCILLFMLSILSKPIGIVFFPIAFLYSILIDKTPLKQILSIHVSLLFISLISIFLTTSSQPSFVLRYHTPFFARFLIWIDAINFYVIKILLPIHLSPSYARTPQVVLSHWYTYVIWIIPIVLFLVMLIKKKKLFWVLFAFSIFVVGFLPVSGIIPFIFQNWSTVADRYVYIPMIGIAFLVSYVFSRHPNKILGAFILILAAIFCLRTFFIHLPVWKKNLTLWTHCIEVTPQEPNAYYNRGNAYMQDKDYERANKDFEKAIQLNPSFNKALYKKGFILLGMKQFDKALEYFDTILSLDPEFAIAYTAKAVAYYYKKEYEKSWIEVGNARKRGIHVNDDFIRALEAASDKDNQ